MTTTVEGREIRGEVPRYTSTPEPQKPFSDFLDALDAVLGFDGVESVRWHQYTPYFNDGEPCEFSIYGGSIKHESFAEDEGDYEDGYVDDWYLTYARKNEGRYTDLPEELVAAFNKLTDALESGEHYVALKKHFGDPAEVIATTSGFDVEFYDHE